MISWSIRYCYGRGAANVAVPAPRVALEMVPSRSSREIVAALAPLSLALILPLCVLLLAAVNWTAATTQDRVVVVMERSAPLETSEPARELAAATPKPIEPEPPAVEPEATPAEQAPPPAHMTPQEAILALEIDGIGSAPQIPTLMPTASTATPAVLKIAQAGARARDFAPVASTSAPIDIARLEKQSEVVPGLPAVSLPGPSEGPEVEAVGGESAAFAEGLGAPSAPAIAELPGPVGSRFHEIGLEAEAFGQSSGGAGAAALEGVPLEALAACETREREDHLKQELMRSIESGGQCSGNGGTYSFLEAKNLNAFLMRVSRDEQRALGNRCDELMRAQMCVDAQRVGGRNQ